METNETEPKPTPVHKANVGPLQLAVWSNDYTTKEGEQRVSHTVTLERNYKNKEDEWAKTTQLRDRDLGQAIALLQNAQQFLVKVPS